MGKGLRPFLLVLFFACFLKAKYSARREAVTPAPPGADNATEALLDQSMATKVILESDGTGNRDRRCGCGYIFIFIRWVPLQNNA
jgi:hypothetical protein